MTRNLSGNSRRRHQLSETVNHPSSVQSGIHEIMHRALDEADKKNDKHEKNCYSQRDAIVESS